MKKILYILILIISTIALISCSNTKKDITCEEIIEVYKEAGYEVFHKKEYDEESKEICYLQCTAPNSEDYIIFHFYETQEAAEEYADERKWNVILFVFSCAMFEPTWLTTKTYNNIEIEFHKNYLYKPFKSLL